MFTISLNFLFDISYLSSYRKLILFYEIVHDVLITMTLSVSVAATQKEKQKYGPRSDKMDLMAKKSKVGFLHGKKDQANVNNY